MDIIRTNNGLIIHGQLIKRYAAFRVYFVQDRICITDHSGNELHSIDLLEILSDLEVRLVDMAEGLDNQ